ncbi:MAG: hypothetical protein GY830_04000 [Bacteroidetes bacterium]|nr:hypothetical protein [Bacteroidota bacterium]
MSNFVESVENAPIDNLNNYTVADAILFNNKKINQLFASDGTEKKDNFEGIITADSNFDVGSLLYERVPNLSGYLDDTLQEFKDKFPLTSNAPQFKILKVHDIDYISGNINSLVVKQVAVGGLLNKGQQNRDVKVKLMKFISSQSDIEYTSLTKSTVIPKTAREIKIDHKLILDEPLENFLDGQ